MSRSNKILSLRSFSMWVIGLAFVPSLIVTGASGQSYSVIHAFQGPPTDGANPVAGVIADPAGNLYGTTSHGGLTDYGTVFKLANKTFKGTLLHSFSAKAGEGFRPVAGLVRDSKGNLYGTTESGGNRVPAGTVFEVDASGNETILYTFLDGADGGSPEASLVRDSKGNLYGTTVAANGTSPTGVVFKLAPAAAPPWTETVLHAFRQPDGVGPQAGLLRDLKGNLFGTTYAGGTIPRGAGYGVVFKLTTSKAAPWNETLLYTFGDTNLDGSFPLAGVIMDGSGNLYGTTSGSNINGGGGAVFELSPNLDGGWTETLLYAFCAQIACADGRFPEAGLVMDPQGNLYGTTNLGGSYDHGLVFKLTPSISPLWTETILYSFTGKADGGNPSAGLLLDKKGNLYGTTSTGGDLSACGGDGCGVVFKVTP